MKKFKRHRDYGFWDQDLRLSRLTELGDPLEKLISQVNFELFRPFLIERLTKLSPGKGGRPAYDYVLMFKILILQRFYNLSDDQMEYQINDRMSFMRFLDLTIADDVPDSKTIWHFRERLVDLGIIQELFQLFIDNLEDKGLVAQAGKIIDASFIQVPIQRNTKEENTQIKEGKCPDQFIENPHKLCQKDLDARWTKKNNESIFGYKLHAKVDKDSKLITNYSITDASVHDSQALSNLLDIKDENQKLYADSAYTGAIQEQSINSHKMINYVCEKGVRNRPLTDVQIQCNKVKSKTRVRVEHVFGFMEMSMNGMYLNAVGIRRISTSVGLMCLTYNMFRKVQITHC